MPPSRREDLIEAAMRVFERLCIDDRSVTDVARELEMSANAVYAAKHRAIERLRRIAERLEAEF